MEVLPPELKFQTFNSFDDYIMIDKFYKELEKRNNRISETEISANYIVNSNNECANLANKSLNEIDWTKYDLKKTYMDRILAIPLIILGSLFVLYICEGIPFYFLSTYIHNRLAEQSTDVFAVIPSDFILLLIGIISITIIVRSISSMLIVIQIEKISTFQQNDIAYNNDLLDSISIAKYKKKIFLISLLIIGVPTSVIMEQLLGHIISTLNFELYVDWNDLFQVHDLLTNPLADYPLTYILLEIGRMTILVWIITKLHFKRVRKIFSDLRK
jgi:hypothetical protein